MTKTEFLKTLRTKLSGEVSASEIEHTIRYYDEYISEAVSNGKTEQQVMDELGSPLLIARTIIDTADMQRENTGKYTYGSDMGTEEKPEMKFHRVDLNSWTTRLVIVLVIIVFFVLVFTILKVMLPILIPLFAIWLIVTMIRNGGPR